ncbi:hypothetical protein SmJEL517_g01964 [Synchytrium microbalum]|uniref:Uncharacterized protein n=1 Tax=Synchytrium microbalum TaxID=1806994 RepID=A0A507C909_9FUNG|nr:uncharacterized protein SmJEL517_g01964 [Synchytrium microbalum]TPX35649.1 hypothetical protein SmJEL517_g01964 [Synchytrium microbalum]
MASTVVSSNASVPAQQRLASMNEGLWMQIGTLAETVNELDKAMSAYESALRHNPYSIPALTGAAALCRAKEQYGKAVEFYQRVLNINGDNGEVWGALGYCYLMMEDLQKAYTAYQQALYHLPNPKEPKLWYGIGILYDRYGSYDHAEEAFSAVIRMDQKFEKANEIYFRLGIIYKQQGKHELSLQCFQYILTCPPKPLTEIDIWFQIGHVYEQQKEYQRAREAYEKVLAENPNHAKVLQQLGWLYHQQPSTFSNQELAISFLTRSIEADQTDAQTWYLLGRCYMAQQKYNKAYDAYQQAVYRDGRNPTFWCSIGVLYYQINQYRDALDAYSRAIRLNPYISEVWYDLGTLYESCNNQVHDALDAYSRALELDPNNPHIKQRLQMLRNQAAGTTTTTGHQSPHPSPPDTTSNNVTAAPPKTNGNHVAAGPTPFYQGPTPPTQMDYARQDSRSSSVSSHDHERRELPMIQQQQQQQPPPQQQVPPPPSSSYPPHSVNPVPSLHYTIDSQQQQQQHNLPSIINRQNNGLNTPPTASSLPGLKPIDARDSGRNTHSPKPRIESPYPPPPHHHHNNASPHIQQPQQQHHPSSTVSSYSDEDMSGNGVHLAPLSSQHIHSPTGSYPPPNNTLNGSSMNDARSRPSSASKSGNGTPLRGPPPQQGGDYHNGYNNGNGTTIHQQPHQQSEEDRRAAEAAHVAAAAALVDVASQPRDRSTWWNPNGSENVERERVGFDSRKSPS